MLERDFQRQVIQLAKMYGWRVAHFGNTVKFVRKKEGGYRTIPDPDGAGFPDLVLLRRGELIFAELKGVKGRLRPAQEEWLSDLSRVQEAQVYVWKPDDLDRIAKILS